MDTAYSRKHLFLLGALLLSVAFRMPARATEPDGADVLVNDPTGDTPEFTTQSETTLAVLGSTVCAAYVDTFGGGVSGFSRSEDGGQTWEDRGTTQMMSDPVLAVHEASGTFYLAANAWLSFSDIGVSRSIDDCRSFFGFVNASHASGLPVDQEDKPWIAVDNSGREGDGNVYVCWTRFVDGLFGDATSGEIHFSRSTDGGASFTDDQVISGPFESFPFGCSIAVGPRGEVYAAWVNRDQSAGRPVLFRSSLDGGLTWEPAVQVNTLPLRHPGLDRVRQCEPGNNRRTLNGDIRMLPQAWIAVDKTGGPFTGNVYVVWADDPAGAIDNSDVVFSRSIDGGLTWAPEMQVAADTETDQFEPFVGVGGAGTVALAWYDRRNDPEENFAIDVYSLFSRDGGETLDPIRRVTDVSFPVPPLTGQPSFSGNFDLLRSACYMGEYVAVAGDAESFYYAWGDNRNTVFSETYPEGRPDPDVYFDRRAVPRVVHPGDASCDGRLTAADLPALVGLIARDDLAVCAAGDADRDGAVAESDAAAVIAAIVAEELPRRCGGEAETSCRDGEICEGAAGACGEPASEGICVSRPTRCLDRPAPVCGCDGVTYDNDCLRRMAEVGLERDGPCT